MSMTACRLQVGRTYLVTEFLDNGDLFNAIANSMGGQYGWYRRCAEQLACLALPVRGRPQCCTRHHASATLASSPQPHHAGRSHAWHVQAIQQTSVSQHMPDHTPMLANSELEWFAGDRAAASPSRG